MLIFLLILLLALSLAVLFQRRLLNAVILLGVFSLVSSIIYFLVGAPDVAVAEGALGVAFVTFIYVLALSDQGKLRVLAEEVPPFLYQEKGELQGFEQQILKEFARDMNLELEVEFVSHAELASETSNYRADLIGGAYFSEYEVPLELTETEGYHQAEIARIELGSDKPRIGFLTAMNLAQFTAGKGWEVTYFPTLDEMVKAYNRGDITGFVGDSGRLSTALKRLDAPLQRKSEITKLGRLEYRFGVTAGGEDLSEALDTYLDEMKQTGKLQELAEEHLG